MTVPKPDHWPVYAPDPKCPHDTLVDSLPEISNEEQTRYFNETGIILLRLRQWTCTQCGGESFDFMKDAQYVVDHLRNTATKQAPAPLVWSRKRLTPPRSAAA